MTTIPSHQFENADLILVSKCITVEEGGDHQSFSLFSSRDGTHLYKYRQLDSIETSDLLPENIIKNSQTINDYEAHFVSNNLYNCFPS